MVDDDGAVLTFPTAVDPVPVPADIVRSASRPYRAWEKLTEGYSWAEIAQLEGYPTAAAAKTDVQLWTARANALVADMDRQTMLSSTVAGYDRLIKAFMPAALQGDDKAAAVVQRSLKSKTDLLHLDAMTAANEDDGAIKPSVVQSDSYIEDLENVISND